MVLSKDFLAFCGRNKTHCLVEKEKHNKNLTRFFGSISLLSTKFQTGKSKAIFPVINQLIKNKHAL